MVEDQIWGAFFNENILAAHRFLRAMLHFFFSLLFRAPPTAYVGFQARGPIGAVAAGLHHSHSKARSELHLRPSPQLRATSDP